MDRQQTQMTAGLGHGHSVNVSFDPVHNKTTVGHGQGVSNPKKTLPRDNFFLVM